MSHVVVDASVAAKWVLNEPDSEAARRIFERGPLLVPDLLWAELGSLLWRRQRVGEFSVADARMMLLDLRKLPVKSYAINPLLPLAFEIALAIDHSVYDCVYLALADRENCRVVTARSALAQCGRLWSVGPVGHIAGRAELKPARRRGDDQSAICR